VAAIGKAADIVVDTDARTGEATNYASAHDLRRAFGHRWAKRVMPAVLQKLMRHSSIQTTMQYYVSLEAENTAEVLWRATGNT
jgi:integrase